MSLGIKHTANTVTKDEYLLLFEKCISGKATPEEQKLLEEFKDEFELLHLPWNETRMGNREHTKQLIEEELQQSIGKNKRYRRIIFLKGLTAAAAVLLFVSTVFFIQHRKNEKQTTAVAASKVNSAGNTILPGGDRATLTLADGSIITLDTVHNGNISGNGATKIIKLDGKLAYQPGDSTAIEVTYNTLSTPKGGQYQLLLQDGTKVWLNAASSLRFPTAFTGENRIVELTGEAYFEVAQQLTAQNKKKPFTVQVNEHNMDVHVLGTHFNVMAYNNEAVASTTLLEGKVQLQKGNATAVLQPGEEAVVKKEDDLFNVQKADVDRAVAWKNGRFLFNKADISVVMRQLERWYDIEVIYEGKVPKQRFWGGIERNLPLSSVLSILEQSEVKFRIEDRKLIVLKSSS